jgi:5'-3' exonuclease
MGIFKFYASFLSRKQGIKVNKIPLDVSSLFIDMNAIFHNSAQKIYCYQNGDPKKLEERMQEDLRKKKFIKNREQKKIFIKEQLTRQKEMKAKSDNELQSELFDEIVLQIYTLINKVKPQEYVVLAVDGVAPTAKITQQRKRRYASGLESEKRAVEGKEPLRFNGNCITPGTDFMFSLDEALQKSISANIKNNVLNITVANIVYSSHLVPGEGEHKIFDQVRKRYITPSEDGAKIVYGADADLVMLTLLSEMSNIYLCREELDEFFSIDSLRNDIYKDLVPVFKNQFGVANTPTIPIKIAIQDFVLMIYLFGNDFLPHLPAFEDFNKCYNRMQFHYQNINLPLTNMDGQVIWENFAKFLSSVSKDESALLTEEAKIDYFYPFKMLTDSCEEVKVKTTDYNDGSLDTTETKLVLNFNKFSKAWYDRALTPRTQKGKDIFQIEVSEDKIDDMCIEYFKGIQWVMQYYLHGDKGVTNRYVYIYHYAPLLRDLARVLNTPELSSKFPSYQDVLKNEADPIITPIHQLISVMPQSSWYLIPQPFRALMSIRFQDISPSGFEIEIEGKKKEESYRSTVILSIVDPVRIDDDIKDIPIDVKFNEAKTRYPHNTGKIKIPTMPSIFKILANEPAKVMVDAKIEEEFTVEEVEEVVVKEITPPKMKVKEKIERKKFVSDFVWIDYQIM